MTPALGGLRQNSGVGGMIRTSFKRLQLEDAVPGIGTATLKENFLLIGFSAPQSCRDITLTPLLPLVIPRDEYPYSNLISVVISLEDFKQYDVRTNVCGACTEAEDGVLIFSEYTHKSSVDTIIFII